MIKNDQPEIVGLPTRLMNTSCGNNGIEDLFEPSYGRFRSLTSTYEVYYELNWKLNLGICTTHKKWLRYSCRLKLFGLRTMMFQYTFEYQFYVFLDELFSIVLLTSIESEHRK